MFKQIVNTFYTKVITGIFNLVIAIIISNYLGADGKGVQGLILTTISVFVIFSGVIGPGGLTYLLPRIHFYLLIIPSYAWSIVVVVAMGVVLSFIDIIPGKYIIHVVLLAFMGSVIGINNSILQVRKQIQQINLLNIIQITITLSIIVYFFVYKGILSIKPYIIGLYVGYGTSILMGFVHTRGNYVNAKFSLPSYKYIVSIKKHFRYGGYNQLDILAQVLSFRLAFYFLNYFLNLSEVGIYSNAVSIVESVWILSRSIAFVQHSRIVNSKNKNYTIGLTLNFIKLSLSLAFLAILTLVFIPVKFYQFVFGAEFGGIRTVILALSPGILFFSISFILSAYFSGTGKHYINSGSSILGLFFVVIASLLLIPRLGLIGAGLAASSSYFITTLVKMIMFFKIGKISIKQVIPNQMDILEFLKLFSKEIKPKK